MRYEGKVLQAVYRDNAGKLISIEERPATCEVISLRQFRVRAKWRAFKLKQKLEFVNNRVSYASNGIPFYKVKIL